MHFQVDSTNEIATHSFAALVYCSQFHFWMNSLNSEGIDSVSMSLVMILFHCNRDIRCLRIPKVLYAHLKAIVAKLRIDWCELCVEFEGKDLHSSQNELPQHGIMTASLNRSLQMLQIKSSGTSCFFSAPMFGVASSAGELPAAAASINERGMPVFRFTSTCGSWCTFSGQFFIQWPVFWHL